MSCHCFLNKILSRVAGRCGVRGIKHLRTCCSGKIINFRVETITPLRLRLKGLQEGFHFLSDPRFLWFLSIPLTRKFLLLLLLLSTWMILFTRQWCFWKSVELWLSLETKIKIRTLKSIWKAKEDISRRNPGEETLPSRSSGLVRSMTLCPIFPSSPSFPRWCPRLSKWTRSCTHTEILHETCFSFCLLFFYLFIFSIYLWTYDQPWFLSIETWHNTP